MSLSNVSPVIKREFVEFLKQKIDKVNNELSELNEALAEAESDEDLKGLSDGHMPSGNGTYMFAPPVVQIKNKLTVGWKYKVKSILEQKGALTFAEILKEVMRLYPDTDERVASSSLSSALSSNSKPPNNTIVKNIVNGVHTYSIKKV